MFDHVGSGQHTSHPVPPVPPVPPESSVSSVSSGRVVASGSGGAAGRPDPLGVLPLAATATRTAACDPRDVAGEILMDGLVQMEVALRALHAARASWLAELDRRGTTDALTGHRTAPWLAVHTGCSRRSAARALRLGRRLAHPLGAVHRALASGEVSSDHAEVLGDLAAGHRAEIVAACQNEFLELAASMSFERWREVVRGLVDLADADGGFRPGPEASTLRLTAGFGGSVGLDATLVGDEAVVVRESLDRAVDRLRLRYRHEVQAGARNAVPALAELRAEALVELLRRGTAATTPGRAPATELVLVGHAADPLGRECGVAPALPGGGWPRGERPARPDPGPTARPSSVRPLHAPSSASGPLSEATVRTLCCDPVLRAVVVDSLGNPVDLGRRTRIVPPGLRRAVEVRDGGCVFPGCDAPPHWCDLHHVVHWADGGSTSAANLASLCRHHHGVTHRTGWAMRADPRQPQRFVWTRPDGTALRSQRHGVPPPD